MKVNITELLNAHSVIVVKFIVEEAEEKIRLL